MRSPAGRVLAAAAAVLAFAACAPAAAQARRTYFTEFLSPDGWAFGLRQRPARIHGGSDFGWHSIRWYSWGAARAVGHGRAYYINKTFVPYRRQTWRAKFVLDARGECFGRMVYRRLTVLNGATRPGYIRRVERSYYPCSNAQVS